MAKKSRRPDDPGSRYELLTKVTALVMAVTALLGALHGCGLA